MAAVPTPAPAVRRTAKRRQRSELLRVVERRLGVTPAGLTLLAVAIAAYATGQWLGSHGLFLLAYGLIIIFAICWGLGRRKLAVVATRGELPTRVRQGRPVEVQIVLEAKRRISTVVLEEHLDPALGLPVRVPVPLLAPGTSLDHSYTFTPQRRGIFPVGPMIVEYSDPFGLTRRRLQITARQDLIVHPRTEGVSDRVSSREWEDPPVRPPISKPWPTGFEFYGMREYTEGDDPRRINWRAFARHDVYLVQESEQGITDRVNIFLDTDASTHTKGDPSETFETAVKVAASVAERHLKDGFSVSVETNARRLVNSLRGQSKRVELLDELTAVNPNGEPLTAALERLLVSPNRSAHNVVITPNISYAAASRLRVLLSRGTWLLVVHVMSDDTDPGSVHRAASLGAQVVEVEAGQALARVFGQVISAVRR